MRLTNGRRVGGVALSVLIFFVVTSLWGMLVTEGWEACWAASQDDPDAGQSLAGDLGGAAGYCSVSGMFSFGFFVAVALIVLFWLAWRRRYGAPDEFWGGGSTE